MTTLTDRPNTALLVIDMQRGVVADAHTTEDMREWGAPIGPADAIGYTNLYWSFTNAPGRTADVAPAADVAFSR